MTSSIIVHSRQALHWQTVITDLHVYVTVINRLYINLAG